MHFHATTTTLLSIASLAISAPAAPVDCSSSVVNSYPASTITPGAPAQPGVPKQLTIELLESIAPKTVACPGNLTWPEECHNSKQAVPAINAAYTKYGLNSVGEQATALAMQIFESQSFQFNKNHFPAPGNPGQGTKNMQSPAFNLKYAQSLFPNATVQAAQDMEKVEKNAGLKAVLELVSGINETFGSASWFIATQCKAEVRKGLQAETEQGFRDFLRECVDTPFDPLRVTGWAAAVKGMGGNPQMLPVTATSALPAATPAPQ